jgi:hypothetical protein
MKIKRVYRINKKAALIGAIRETGIPVNGFYFRKRLTGGTWKRAGCKGSG